MIDIFRRIRVSSDLDRHTVIIFGQSTYVRISINWKWQQVAPIAHPIEIDTDINIIILSGKILDTKYLIYEEIFWYKGIQSWRNPSEKKDIVWSTSVHWEIRPWFMAHEKASNEGDGSWLVEMPTLIPFRSYNWELHNVIKFPKCWYDLDKVDQIT